MPTRIPKLILVVEDSVDDYEVVERSFTKINIANRPTRVKGGDEALNYLFRKGDYVGGAQRPSLILLDLNISGTNGHEVLKVIKSDEDLKVIPVFVLTTSDFKGDIEKVYQGGANSYMQKPSSVEALVEAVKRMRDLVFEVSLLPEEFDVA